MSKHDATFLGIKNNVTLPVIRLDGRKGMRTPLLVYLGFVLATASCATSTPSTGEQQKHAGRDPTEAVGARLEAECVTKKGRYIAQDDSIQRFEGFTLTLPGSGWCRVDLGGKTWFIGEALDVEELARMGRDRSLAQRFHTIAAYGGLLPAERFGDELRSMQSLRRALEADVAAAAGRSEQRTSDPLLPLSGGPRSRMTNVSIGPDVSGTQCIPVHVSWEERSHPSLPPGTILRVEDRRRYCLSGRGDGAVASFSERYMAGDPDARRRSGRLEAVASEFLSSLVFTRQ
ncbi:hypothetical protein [Elioraea rosea]|uniref:hypothetical protein n=1 Tax=Elioraea rosea TaxID=2492390 RepID=UPI0011844735|nr:hypothetical protein [Elioraea rosea]